MTSMHGVIQAQFPTLPDPSCSRLGATVMTLYEDSHRRKKLSSTKGDTGHSESMWLLQVLFVDDLAQQLDLLLVLIELPGVGAEILLRFGKLRFHGVGALLLIGPPLLNELQFLLRALVAKYDVALARARFVHDPLSHSLHGSQLRGNVNVLVLLLIWLTTVPSRFIEVAHRRPLFANSLVPPKGLGDVAFREVHISEGYLRVALKLSSGLVPGRGLVDSVVSVSRMNPSYKHRASSIDLFLDYSFKI